MLRAPRPWGEIATLSAPSESQRRDVVVGISPNDRSLVRLAASVVIEQNGEWLVDRRYLSAHSLEAVLDREKEDEEEQECQTVRRSDP